MHNNKVLDVNEKIWCCKEDRVEDIDSDSIGSWNHTMEWVIKNRPHSTCDLFTIEAISRELAIGLLVEDILDYDDENLKLGSWVRVSANVKLNERLNGQES